MSIGDFPEHSQSGIKRRLEGAEEPPAKRAKLEVGPIVRSLHQLASLSREEFQKVSSIETITHSLLSKISSGELRPTREGVKEIKNDLRVVKARVKTHPLMDDTGKKQCLADIKDLQTSIKGGSKMKVETALPQSLLPLVDVTESLVLGLASPGHEHIKFDHEQNQLVFSDELAKQLDDTMLENILKVLFTRKALPENFSIDIAKYPLLGPKAPALLLKYGNNVPKSCFVCIDTIPHRFCNHTLVVEDRHIPVNKEFLATSSPYFKALFETPMRMGEESEKKTTLHECDPKMVSTCMKALTGNFDITKVDNVNFLLSFLRHAHLFQLDELVNACKNTLTSEEFITSSLQQAETVDDAFEWLDDLMGHLKLYFPEIHLGNPLGVVGAVFNQNRFEFIKNISDNSDQYEKKYPHLGIRSALANICLECLEREDPDVLFEMEKTRTLGTLFPAFSVINPASVLDRHGVTHKQRLSYFGSVVLQHYQETGKASDREKVKEWYADVSDYYLSRGVSYAEEIMSQDEDSWQIIKLFVDGTEKDKERALFLTESLGSMIDEDELVSVAYLFLLARQNKMEKATHRMREALSYKYDSKQKYDVRQLRKMFGCYLARLSPLPTEELYEVTKKLPQEDPIRAFLMWVAFKEPGAATPKEELASLKETFRGMEFQGEDIQAEINKDIVNHIRLALDSQ